MHTSIIPSVRPAQLRQSRPVRQLPFVLVLMPLTYPPVVSDGLNRPMYAVLVLVGGGQTLVPSLEEGIVVVEGDGAVDGLAIGYGLWAGG